MSGTINCEALRSAMKTRRELTAEEQEHVEQCEDCMDAWLEATATQALETKPEVRIPADFTARVAAKLPEKRLVSAQREPSQERHWGLVTAIILVAVGLAAAAVADPRMMTTGIGVIAMTIVAAEIAGIGLWLGCWPRGRMASRGHSRWS